MQPWNCRAWRGSRQRTSGLFRKAADQAGLTAALSAALRKAGTSPVLDWGIVLVSMAAAAALGAMSMSDIAVLAQLAPVLGDAPSGSALPTPCTSSSKRAWPGCSTPPATSPTSG
ncbi:MAG TPA: hypothetical protein VHY31_26535 [Streptosporangiaceae bacterium]|jgi:ABC-type protease/lipase transport system fused ATPase/permease subunit|nr:hypothetical protein [Streptosporangiaceae bacterium]